MMFAEAVEMASMDGRIPVITAPADGKSTFNLRNIYRKELRVYGVDTRRLDAVTYAQNCWLKWQAALSRENSRPSREERFRSPRLLMPINKRPKAGQEYVAAGRGH